VKLGLPGAPPSLDPTKSFSANDLPVTGNIYESLLRYDGELQPWLAHRYTANADATQWSFTLRADIKFHDGTTLDAAAVKSSIEYHGQPGSAVAFLVGATNNPPTIDTPDPLTVLVTFGKPFPEFGRYMSVVKIISPKLLNGPDDVVAKRVNATPVGSGPFQFVERTNADTVTTAFPGYWGSGPFVKDVIFKVVPDDSTRISALQAGDLDIVTKVPPPTADGLRRLQRMAAPTLTVVQMALATSRPPFNDARVRRALMHAVDREAIAASLFRGNGVVTGSPLPPGAYGFHRPTTQYNYDPARSKALLQEAGHTLPVRFTMVIYDSLLLASLLGQAIAQMANAAGFEVECRVVDQGVGDKDLVKEADRAYDVFILENGFVGGSALHVNNVEFYSQYQGATLHQQISEMNSVADGPLRLLRMAAVQETWARELPCLPLWTCTFIDACDSSLAGFTPPLDGYQPQLGPAYRPVHV
jgi:peptide/nickel transport system substrate-binding protein